MVTVQQLITKIETRQPVINHARLSDEHLATAVIGIGSLNTATAQQLSFLSAAKFVNQLTMTKAGVVLVTDDKLSDVPNNSIPLVVASPYLAYASCSQLFQLANTSADDSHTNIHPTAVIAENAVIGQRVSIGAYTVIGDNVQIGEGSVIEANVHIAEGTQIGNYVRIHGGANIGSEGFGFAPTVNPSASSNGLSGWERIVQLGGVRIGNYVRIGANTTIDRGAIADTIIGDNVIIDNQVQVAHNVQIGAGTAIAAKTGIAGSTKIGKNCIIGGAVGITGHIEIVDNVTISGMTMVTKSLTKAGNYSSGIPVMPSADWRRAVVKFRQLIKR